MQRNLKQWLLTILSLQKNVLIIWWHCVLSPCKTVNSCCKFLGMTVSDVFKSLVSEYQSESETNSKIHDLIPNQWVTHVLQVCTSIKLAAIIITNQSCVSILPCGHFKYFWNFSHFLPTLSILWSGLPECCHLNVQDMRLISALCRE